jgi:hypothetical protein
MERHGWRERQRGGWDGGNVHVVQRCYVLICRYRWMLLSCRVPSPGSGFVCRRIGLDRGCCGAARSLMRHARTRHAHTQTTEE